jgi:2,3-bisphosphoglycerate-dependent phosphoglycerate mutase
VPRPYYLVRHGESEWNVLQLTQGQTVAPRLTARGRDQARRAAEVIRADLGATGRRVEVIRTSDLARAVETAQILADLLGGVLTTDPRLREQHLGGLEGRPYAETWAAAATHDWSDPDLPVAGGESPRQLRDRMGEALDAVDRTVVTVLVSHGDAIRAAVARLAGLHGNQAPWIEVPNGAVARIRDDGVPRWLRKAR